MRSRSALVLAAFAAAVLLAACVPPPSAPSPAASSSTDPGPLMGPSRVSASQMASWYETKRPQGPHKGVTVNVQQLASLFIEEGNREGVAGDVAFVQSMLETGWLSFPDHGQVRASFNNFAGIGAVDGGSAAGPARFASARIGVRAQIQHLRAYADPTVTCSNFATPTESPRCHLVHPKGRASTWAVMGSGNWATDPNYASKIASLYGEMAGHRR